MSGKKGSFRPGGLINRLIQALKRITAPTTFLCDSCKYDWGSACSRPERPNARICPDYSRK